MYYMNLSWGENPEIELVVEDSRVGPATERISNSRYIFIAYFRKGKSSRKIFTFAGTAGIV